MDNVREKKVVVFFLIFLVSFLYICLFFIHGVSTITLPINAPQYSNDDKDDDENLPNSDYENVIRNLHDNNIFSGASRNHNTNLNENILVNKNVNNDKTNDSGENVNNDVIIEADESDGTNNVEKERIFAVFSTESSQIWDETKEIDLFKNEYFNGKNIIAPGLSGNYNFTIQNDATAFDINYDIKVMEENKYNINMVYRLKLNGDYVAGDRDTWVKCDELNFKNLFLKAQSCNLYSLEWKWQDGQNDTQIGKTKNADYTLKIKVVGTEITE